MSVATPSVQPLVRKLATATCVVALLPIGLGALVTTLGAGMAFADWPSSDGQNMLLYPWLRDFATNSDKFVEHGHRLAGMLIGFVAICLAVAGWRTETRWVRIFVTAILISVILQGLLGGARVLFDRQTLAMIHSLTGACFFSLCIVFRLLCSSGWQKWYSVSEDRIGPFASAVIALNPIAIAGQYVLGGMLRHLHTMRDEHIIGAVVAGSIASAASFFMLRSGHPLMRRYGFVLLAFLVTQLALGAGAFLTRFGLQSIGYVAVAGSASQAVVCSLHTVVGMLLFASSVVSGISLLRLGQAGCLRGLAVGIGMVTDRESLA